MTPLAIEDRQTPGAMEREISREVPGGIVAFEEAPAGWLTKDGKSRRRPWRAYWWMPTDGERVRLPSVSSILESICPKPGLQYWYGDRDIEGVMLALKAGMLTKTSRPEHAIAVVREQGLGAERAKQRAATRGLNVHAINEHYMLTGEPPILSEHPAEHHGYIRSWIKAVIKLKPKAVAVEQLVVHPEHGYAGRLDMRCTVGGLLETWDFKTQEKGNIYRQAHLGCGLYERAAVHCGEPPATHCRIVSLPANGDWNLEQHSMMADHPAWTIDAALAYFRACRPIDNTCNSHNRDRRN